MQKLGPILLALCFLATVAAAKPSQKKKKSSTYNATDFIKAKEAKAPAVGSSNKAKSQASTVAGFDLNCSAAETSKAAPQTIVEKPVGDTKTDDSATNSTQQALEIAKTVVTTVADNCRTSKAAKIEPDVGVSVVQPGDLGAKKSKGERPELSGTVGVSATF